MEISGQEDIYWEKMRRFDGIGLVGFDHPTLQMLCDHMPDLFEKLKRYHSFAVVRDPMERFLSSMYQYLRTSRNIDLVMGQPFSVHNECAEVIEILDRRDGQLPHLFLQFQRQIDFVQKDGVQLVKHLYTLESIDALMRDMGRRMGVDNATIGQDDRSLRLRMVKAHRVVRALNAAAKSVLPYRP